MPGGETHTVRRRSYRCAAIRAPRFDETSWCSGCDTSNKVNDTPTITSGPNSDTSRVIALTSHPNATDVTAGSVPRSTTSTHQPMA